MPLDTPFIFQVLAITPDRNYPQLWPSVSSFLISIFFFFVVSIDTPPFSVFQSFQVSLWMGSSDSDTHQLFSSLFLFCFFDTPPFSVFISIRVSLWMGTSDNPWQTLVITPYNQFALASAFCSFFLGFLFSSIFVVSNDHTSFFCFQVSLGVPMNGN